MRNAARQGAWQRQEDTTAFTQQIPKQFNWTQCLMQYVARIIKKLNELQQNTDTQLNEIKSHVDYDQETQRRDRFLKRNQT